LHFRESYWTTTQILSVPVLKSRARMVEKMISLAQHCLAMNNFSSTFAIVAGLETSAVFRLKKTWELIAPDKKAALEEMVSVLSSGKSYKEYRGRVHRYLFVNFVNFFFRIVLFVFVLVCCSAVGPCLPYLGVYLSDLTFIDEGNSDMLRDTTLINFEKRSMTAKVIIEIQLFQQQAYCFRPVQLLQKYLLSMKCVSESEAYRLSLLHEPRE
jgi:son of sevenless-like protein